MKFKYIVCPNCKKEHISDEHISGFECVCKKILNVDMDEDDVHKIKKELAKSARFLCCDDFELFKTGLPAGLQSDADEV